MSDPKRQTVNEYGYLVNAQGEYVDEQGNKVQTPVKAPASTPTPQPGQPSSMPSTQPPPAKPASGTDQEPEKTDRK